MYDESIQKVKIRYSYMFHSWCWGTWKKIWDRFNHLENENYIIKRQHNLFIDNPSLAKSFQKILNKCKKREIITWDYQFQNFCLINDFKNLMPTISLVENLGIGDKFAENCGYKLPFNKKFNLEKNYSRKFDFKNILKLEIEKEINLFKNKYPSFRDKVLLKIIKIFRR